MTKVEFADKFGIGYQAVSNWEKGGPILKDIAAKPMLTIFQNSYTKLLLKQQ